MKPKSRPFRYRTRTRRATASSRSGGKIGDDEDAMGPVGTSGGRGVMG